LAPQVSSLSLLECHVAKEWFTGGQRLPSETLSFLSYLDLR
jgi:hypothetical protein